MNLTGIFQIFILIGVLALSSCTSVSDTKNGFVPGAGGAGAQAQGSPKSPDPVGPAQTTPLPSPPANEGEQSVHTPPILMYHDVLKVPDNSPATADTLVASFREQLLWLRSQGYVTVSLDELYAYKMGRGTLPARAVVLTFDDCYKGEYVHAAAVLRELQMKATFFVNTGFFSAGGSRKHMTWAQARDLDRDPLFKLYPHGITHPNMTELSDSELDFQMSGSQSVLEHELGGERKYFAYPYGAYDARVMAVAKKYFKMAFSVWNTDNARDDFYNIERMPMQSRFDSLPTFTQLFQAWLDGTFSW